MLDNDLDPFEHSELLDTFDRVVATATDPNERQLALELRHFVISKDVRLASARYGSNGQGSVSDFRWRAIPLDRF